MDDQAAGEILGYQPEDTPFCNCGAFAGGRGSGTVYGRYFGSAQALLYVAKRAAPDDGRRYDAGAVTVGVARAVLAFGSYPGTSPADLESLAQATWGQGSPDWRSMKKGPEKAPFWAAMGKLEPAVHRGTVVAAARLAAYLVAERLDGDMAQDLALRCAERVRLAPGSDGSQVGLDLRRAARGCDVPGVLDLARAAGPLGAPQSALFGHLVRAATAGWVDSVSEAALLGRARERLLADLPTAAATPSKEL